MRESQLPAGGTNLFQEIKKVSAEAAAKGKKLIKLSIGQPAGAALLSARKAMAEACMSDAETMWEYQDNGSPGCPDFAKRFVAGHLRNPITGDVAYLPIPGIKPMLGYIIQACGDSLKIVATTTAPGYPTPKDQAFLNGKMVFEPWTNQANEFLFDPETLLINGLSEQVGLVMTNYPHNPSGAAAGELWWYHLCEFCSGEGKRLFNDAAYGALPYGEDNCLLSEVAPRFPNLSWAEAFSASKLIGNGTGTRVGAIVGSPDFVADIATIKGKSDSGFVAPMAVGALYSLEHDREGIAAVRDLYRRRAKVLCDILLHTGMCPTIEPHAGFFTLWQTPKRAFGKPIADAKEFNLAMIENTGVVGVPFGSYIRYAVAYENVEAVAGEIREAFAKATVVY